MTKYKLNEGDVAFLPGVGKVIRGKHYEGEGYSRFSGGLLVEVPEVPDRKPLESTEAPSGPQPLNEPSPNPGPSKIEMPSILPKPSKVLTEVPDGPKPVRELVEESSSKAKKTKSKKDEEGTKTGG